jgi:hypothetical protein
MRMGRSRTLGLAAAAAAAAMTMTMSRAARADVPAVGVDWGRLLLQLDAYARHGAEKPAPSEHTPADNEQTHQIYVQNAGNAWFGVAPRVSFVARDWGGSYRIAGDKLSVVDAMRLSSSTRMVLSRVRFGDFGTTRIVPFAQMGFGQWRTDTKILPFSPRATEVAAQVGGGVEVQVARGWQLACETAATVFIRDEREDIPQTNLWSTTLATRMEW